MWKLVSKSQFILSSNTTLHDYSCCCPWRSTNSAIVGTASCAVHNHRWISSRYFSVVSVVEPLSKCVWSVHFDNTTDNSFDQSRNIHRPLPPSPPGLPKTPAGIDPEFHRRESWSRLRALPNIQKVIFKKCLKLINGKGAYLWSHQ